MIGRALFVCEALNLARSPRSYALRAGFVVFLLAVVALAWPWNGTPAELQARGFAVFQCFFWAELVAGFFLVPAVVAPAIAWERERRTLDLLMTSPVSDAEIVVGKLASNSLQVLALLAAGVPVGFASLLLGGATPEQLLCAVVSVLLNGVFCAAVSILVSAFADRSGVATALATVIVFAFLSLSLVVGGVAAAFVASSKSDIWIHAFSAFCPWVAYVHNSVTGETSWLARAIAWASNLAFAGAALWLAVVVLRSSRSPRGKRARSHAPPLPKDGIPMAMLPASPPLAAPAHAPIPPPPAAPRAGVTRIFGFLRPFGTHLPVKGNPVAWKDSRFGGGDGRLVVSILGAIACGACLLGAGIAVLSSSGLAQPERAHLPLVFEAAVVVVVCLGAGAGTLGPEREQGTLPLLIGTGMPPSDILRGKLRAAIRSALPALAIVAAHALFAILTSGVPGLTAAAVLVLSGTFALVLSAAVSLEAGKPRRAAGAALALLFALWGVPALAAIPLENHRDTLLQLNPLGLVWACFWKGSPDFVALLVFSAVTLTLSFALPGWTAARMEGRVRA
jgi:ABC-type transport system involved in multi-copper enzyme maturation permease subunit